MKIYNVSLSVKLTQIAEIPDLPAEPPAEPREAFNDDPVDKQEGMLNRYLEKVELMFATSSTPIPMYAEPPGASMTQDVRVAANTFDDLQAILKRFSETLAALPAAPDSLLKNQGRPPMRGR